MKGYGSLSFTRKLDDNDDKKLIETATKTGTDTAKTTSQTAAQKTLKLLVI